MAAPTLSLQDKIMTVNLGNLKPGIAGILEFLAEVHFLDRFRPYVHNRNTILERMSPEARSFAASLSITISTPSSFLLIDLGAVSGGVSTCSFYYYVFDV